MSGRGGGFDAVIFKVDADNEGGELLYVKGVKWR